ncbi:MAG: nitrite reductase (NO-forming) / hydroxylamine reductase [Pseudomonadota bacterium]|nr:nitrite reductase (NO-forming) / hydroxylamine reductase [Pseudomonadota bacterium]
MLQVLRRALTEPVKKSADPKLVKYLLTLCLIMPLIAGNAFAKGPGRNWAPVVNNQSFSVNENSANGTLVGTVVATDSNGDTLSYSITAGNTNGAFAISASSGALTVANSAMLDYETTPTFSLTVRVADPGGLSDTAIITVNLNNVAENTNQPPVVNNQSFSVNENSANGTLVGTVTASDPNGGTLSYSITAGNTNGAFAIGASTGALTVANSAMLDYETTPTFSLTVRVADTGGLSDTAVITVNLNDVFENLPPVVNNQSFSINENSANGTLVGTVIASDPNGGTLSYSITAGNTSSAFAINTSTGALTVANSAALDYETITQFSLTVRVADSGGLSDTATITVSLINVADTTGVANGRAIFLSKCSGCHMHGRGDHLGPDLANRGADGFVSKFIADPAGMIATNPRAANLYQTWGYVMPDYNLTTAQINDIVSFLTYQDTAGPLYPSAPITLTSTQFDQARDLYFNRCAGCHGLYRTGATGPKIDEARSEWIGTEGLGALLRHGTPRGMPNFGATGLISETEITLLSAFLQEAPPTPPSLSMAEIQASWNLAVPVASRPTAPQHSRNWENFFGVVERDAGKISLYDGDTYERIARLDVGFAVHILRSSSTGRYFYAIGRDGLVTLIDLWSATPTMVASVKGCHDARSVDGSKFTGYEDRYVVEGCYWPPQYVVYDGLTLEPLARNDLPMQSITGETLPEVRVAAIAASHHDPVWALGLKESGYVGIVDYSQAGFPLVKNIATERFLHDGGWDHTGRYFLIAANASNKVVAVDMETQTMAASFTTGTTPHPGRGANWLDPVYGWVNATPHIGEPKVSIYGADPAGRPDVAWTVVREVALPSAGTLFLKTHPNSPYVLFDMTLSTTDDKQVCAYTKSTGAIDRCFPVATNGKATHFEFNQAGTEIWVSD